MPRLSDVRYSKNEKISLKLLIKYLKKYEITAKGWIFILFFSFFSSSLTIGASWFLGFIIDKFFKNANLNANNFDFQTFIFLVISLALAYIMQKVFDISYKYLLAKANSKLGNQLRLKSYEKIQKMELAFFEDTKTGDLMSALTNDIQNLTEAIWNLLILLTTALAQFIISFTLMFIYSPLMTIASIIILVLTTTVLVLLIKSNQKNYIEQQEKLAEFNTYLEEVIEAMPLITMHQQQESILKKFKTYNENLMKPDFKASMKLNFLFPWFFFSRRITTLSVILIGILMSINGQNYGSYFPISTGLITSFTLYLDIASENISAILESSGVIQQGLASMSRIEKILNLKPQIDQSKLNDLTYKTGKVEFKNVSFAYPNTNNKLVLKNISFTIPSGKSLALVGETGCGKTTIAKLLSKFYLPTNGSISIDDQNSDSIKDQSWRDYIDTILQDTYIFNDTFRNNIKYINKDIQDQEILNICSEIGILDFVNALPNGLDTKLEANGSNLSEGQRQLLAIIRSLLSNKPLIILDEATSNIDTITEIQIQKVIRYLSKTRTMLFIAHRLSTIKNVDQILLIDKGEIIEQGTHQELIKLDGKYAALYQIGFDES